MAERVYAIAVDERDRACRCDVEIAVDENSADRIAAVELVRRRRARPRPTRGRAAAWDGDEAHRIEILRESRECVGRKARHRQRHGDRFDAGERRSRGRRSESVLELLEDLGFFMVSDSVEELVRGDTRRRGDDRRRRALAEVGDLEHFLDGGDAGDRLLLELP